MFVTIESLNAYGLKIKDDNNSNNEDTIDTLVSNHEREYLDMCLSVGLSEKLTDATKSEDRFIALINQVAFRDGRCRSIGIDKGANYYIYSLWLKKQFEDATSSGVTVIDPLNGVNVDPNVLYRRIHNTAADASIMCLELISENISAYEEFTESEGLSHINPLL